MDGTIIIGTKLDTKGFDAQIKELEAKLKRLEMSADESKVPDEFKRSAEETRKLNAEIEKTRNKLVDLKKEKDKVSKSNVFTPSSSLSDINNSIGSINNSLKQTIGRVIRWGVALLGVRSIYGFLSQSATTLSTYNKQIGADLEYIRFAIASTLQPVVEAIIKLVYKLLSVIGSIAKAWFGIDLFANASVDTFQKGDKALGSSVKKAKELKKTLAGFDEMNVLQDTSSSDTSGGGGVSTPQIDLSKMNLDVNDLFKNWDIDKFIEKGREIAKSIAHGINSFFENTDFKSLAESISKIIRGIPQIITTFITELDWQLIGRSIGEFILNFDWLGLALDVVNLIFSAKFAILDFIIGIMDSIIDAVTDPSFIKKMFEGGANLFLGLVNGFVSLIQKIIEVLKKFLEMVLAFFGIHSPSTVFFDIGVNLILGLIDGVKSLITNLINVFKGIINTLVNLFQSLWNTMVSGAKNAWEGIKSVFSVVTSFFKNIFTNAWTAVKNVFSTGGKIFDGIKDGIVSAFKAIVNAIITGINKVISIPFNAINKVLDSIRNVGIAGIKPFKGIIHTINVPQIPKLAKGGIVNLPSSGVLVGSAIAGESGKEGVIPLTDSQQMALLGEAIGKYININATIPVYVGNRQIAREINRINAEDNFAFNN